MTETSETLHALCPGRIYGNHGNPPLLAILPPPNGTRRLLDCGCGAGDNARLLASAGWRVTGVTISAEERALASRVCQSTFVADLERGLPDEVAGTFDVILMSHLLEHLVNPGNLLNSCRRALSPDGCIAVALPNVMAYPQRFEFLRGRFEYTDTGAMDRTHVRFYSFHTGSQLLSAHGYQVIRTHADGAFPLWKLRKLFPGAAVGAINRTACRVAPNLFAFQSLFLARPGAVA